jgi:hypothetical protein
MRRLLGGFMSAVALVVVLGPLANGYLAHAGYRDLVAGLQQGMPKSEIVQNSYARGWFGSSATLELLIRPDSATRSPGNPMRIRLDSRIEQGPGVWLSGLFPPVLGRVETRAEISGLALSLPVLTVTSDLLVDGSSLIRVHAPPGETPVGPDVLGLRHGELDGLGRFAANGEAASLQVGIPELELLAPSGSIGEFAGVRLEADLAGPVAIASSGSAWLTVARARIDGMAAALGTPGTAPSRFVVEGLSIGFDQGSRDGLLDLRLSLSSERTDSGDRILGPSEIGLAFEHLDTTALGDLAEGLRMLGSGRVAPEMQGLVTAGLVASLAPRLVAGGARLGLDPVRVAMPEGLAMGRLDLHLDPDATLPSWSASGVGDWLALVRADGELDLPEVVALRWLQQIGSEESLTVVDSAVDGSREEAEALLDAWIADGWASRREDRVTSALRLGDGLLTINGKTVPVR